MPDGVFFPSRSGFICRAAWNATQAGRQSRRLVDRGAIFPFHVHLDEKSLALIGNASAQTAAAELDRAGRGIFDKETRRKPLAFAADAAYGD